MKAEEIASSVCQTVADMDDRSSPEDWPEAMLVTGEELHSIVKVAVEAEAPETFQRRVQPWLTACFGEQTAGDQAERNHRFMEEAVELVQACGCTASEAHQLVDYVYARPVGEKAQEVGGVMVTLAALCLAQALDMHEAAETELARIWTMVEAIRAKQAGKPKHSPLPTAPTATMFHDEGAIAQCGACQRYTLNRAALGGRPPICACGEQHYWSGSFEKPGPDAEWDGTAPVAALKRAEA